MKRRLLIIMLLVFACTAMNISGDRALRQPVYADGIDPSSWVVRLEAEAAGAHDSLALMGVQPDATPDYDLQYEVPRPPPPPGGYVMVYFPHDTGNWPLILGTKYAVDFTSPGMAAWRFEVETNLGPVPVTLSWDTSGINQLPESYSIIITDSSTDSVFLMRGRDSYTFSYSNPRTFIVRVEIASSFIPVTRGWNIVSSPRLLDDYTASTLFPEKVSAAYEFDGAYQQRDTLTVGKGYWMKFAAPGLAVLTGFGIDSAAIPVKEGWNLIGSISQTIPAPASPIITTPFYEYSGGYQKADSIVAGRGYWIKVNSDGTLPLGPTALNRPAGNIPGPTAHGTTPGIVRVTDDGGGEVTLEVFSSGNFHNPASYSLPPVPPGDGFDARFADDRGAAIIGQGTESAADLAIAVQSKSGYLRFHGIPESSFQQYHLKTGPNQWKAISGTSEPVAITCGPGRNIFILRISAGPGEPRRFALARNFPNPFNPSTTISYSLPADARVSVVVRDLTGRAVFRSDDRTEEAGDHHLFFDAASLQLGSGIYLVSVSGVTLTGAGTFGGSGKMIYLK